VNFRQYGLRLTESPHGFPARARCLVTLKRDAGLGSEGRVGQCLRPPVRPEKHTSARVRFRPPKPDYARTIDAEPGCC
jgi:hypothetical protein